MGLRRVQEPLGFRPQLEKGFWLGNRQPQGCGCRASTDGFTACLRVRPRSCEQAGKPPYRLRPYCSWDDTQSEDEMALANEISPASATAPTISANL